MSPLTLCSCGTNCDPIWNGAKPCWLANIMGGLATVGGMGPDMPEDSTDMELLISVCSCWGRTWGRTRITFHLIILICDF